MLLSSLLLLLLLLQSDEEEEGVEDLGVGEYSGLCRLLLLMTDGTSEVSSVVEYCILLQRLVLICKSGCILMIVCCSIDFLFFQDSWWSVCLSVGDSSCCEVEGFYFKL